MEPFTVQAALEAPPENKPKGLIVPSYGVDGTELDHSSIAEALARDGYLVAALPHPGDNWQDDSLPQKDPGAYFTERPRQVSHVIGAVSHSAGDCTMLALVGRRADLSRIRKHCEDERAADPLFCGVNWSNTPPTASPPAASGHRSCPRCATHGDARSCCWPRWVFPSSRLRSQAFASPRRSTKRRRTDS